jgi:hypothetical protein
MLIKNRWEKQQNRGEGLPRHISRAVALKMYHIKVCLCLRNNPEENNNSGKRVIS